MRFLDAAGATEWKVSRPGHISLRDGYLDILACRNRLLTAIFAIENPTQQPLLDLEAYERKKYVLLLPAFKCYNSKYIPLFSALKYTFNSFRENMSGLKRIERHRTRNFASGTIGIAGRSAMHAPNEHFRRLTLQDSLLHSL